MVNMPKMFKSEDNVSGGHLLPLLPLRDIVIFPYMVAPLFVGREKSVSALATAMGSDKRVFLSTQKKADIDSPSEKDISEVGVIGNVMQLLRLPDGTVKALVEGKQRARITRFIKNEEFFQVAVEELREPDESRTEIMALERALLENFEEYAKHNKGISKELTSSVSAISDPSQLADTIAAHFSFKIEDKQRLLNTLSLVERLSLDADQNGDRGLQNGSAYQGSRQDADGKDAKKLLSERTDARHPKRDGNGR